LYRNKRRMGRVNLIKTGSMRLYLTRTHPESIKLDSQNRHCVALKKPKQSHSYSNKTALSLRFHGSHRNDELFLRSGNSYPSFSIIYIMRQTDSPFLLSSFGKDASRKKEEPTPNEQRQLVRFP
jgi:hypothetical protein